jgi:hypothetical protein
MRESSLELVDVVARSAALGPGVTGCGATSVGHFDASYTAKGCTAYYLCLIEKPSAVKIMHPINPKTQIRNC